MKFYQDFINKYIEKEAMNGEYNNCVIKGNAVLMPSQINSNINYNVLKACEHKYNNTVQKINEEQVIIIAVKNIKINTISSKMIRESNASATRFYFDMVVDLINIKEGNEINCNITAINKDFIEATIQKTKRIIIFVVLDETTIDDGNSNAFEMRDQTVIVKDTGMALKIGDVLHVRCDEIIPSMKDIVVISYLLENKK